MVEQWGRVIIENQKTNYEISTLGRLRNITRLNWKTKGILKPKFNKSNGYYSYNLSVNEKNYTKYVHRLVAQTFIPNPNLLPQVNHIDGNKSNNCLNNLEWVTEKQNMQHAFKNGLVPTTTPITLYTLQGNKISDFDSISDAIRFIFKTNNKTFTKNLAINNTVLKQDKNNTNCQYYGVQWRLKDIDIRPVYNIEKTCRKTNIPIVKLTMDNKVVKVYHQIHIAYIEMNKIDNGVISQVCKGKRNSYNGFKWQYYSDFIQQQ